MTITGLAIKRPILFIVFFLILGGASIFSYQRLTYELLPNLATPIITIYTAYPGASPEDVENSVTKKIEDASAGVGKSKKLIGSSSDNLSVVSIEFMAEANEDLAEQEVQRAVNGILSDLPNGVKAPVLEKFSVNDLPVLKLGVTAGMGETALYDLVNNQLRPRIAQVKGVGRVKILGGAPLEMEVLGNQEKLTSSGLSMAELSESIRASNLDYPAGNMEDRDARFGIRLSGKLTDSSQIEHLKIREYPDGSELSVKDVARVQTGHKEEEMRSRLDGRASIALFVNKQSGANAVQVAKDVKLELQHIEQEYSAEKVKFDIALDSSGFTLKAAHNVYEDLGIAVMLVALVMLLFLHSIRNAFIVMVSIPASLFSAFIMMYALDYSLNLMTLLAVSLVVGVLVDDSIVVLENIYRHLERGKSKRDAALDGRNEIGFAALSITLVDVVVFLPMSLVPGLVGSLIKEFSLVIVVSTLSSLVISFTLTPMIASRFARLEELSNRTLLGRAGGWIEGGIHALTEDYGRLLGWSLAHKWIIAVAAVSLLGGSLLLLTSNIVGTEFLPQADKGELSLFVDMQPGTGLTRTDSSVRAIENKLKTIPEITRTFSNIGYQNDGFDEKYDPGIATIDISLVPANKRTKSLTGLARELRVLSMQVEGVKARVSPIGLFGANEAPVQLLVTGIDRDSVARAANAILSGIRNVNGIVSPRLSAAPGKPEVSVVIDRDKMAKAGLTVESVGDALRLDIFGNDQLKFRQQGNEVDARLRLEEDQRNQTDQLLNYTFMNTNNQLVYLSQFAKVSLQSGPSTLERRNKRPSMLLLAQVTGRPVGDVGDDIRKVVQDLNISKGTSVLYEGDLELEDDSFNSLGTALLVSLILIYLIMVVLYNNWSHPFVLLFSIPLSISGALLALALNAKSLNVFSIFGLIMMMGLVVKNGILLVDKANDLLKDQDVPIPVRDALVAAGKIRLRPILMTTLAMVAGMLPLALAGGASAAFSSGMAWVLIGGLSSSMILTLVVVPVVYDAMSRLRDKFSILYRDMPRLKTGRTLLIFLLLAASLYNGNPVQAQEKAVQTLTKRSFTLKEAVAAGLKANPRIQLAALDTRKAAFGVKEAQSYLYPRAGAFAQYNRNILPAVFFLPDFSVNAASQIVFNEKSLQPINVSSLNAYDAAVNINIPLFNKEAAEDVKAAHLNKDLTDANMESDRWELADEIRKAYFDVLIAHKYQILMEASLNRSVLNLLDSRRLMEKGFADRNDTLNAWSNVQLMTLNNIKAETGIKQAENRLKFLLDIPLPEPVELTDNIDPQLMGEEKGYMRDTAGGQLTSRPDIKIMDGQRAIAKQQITMARSRYLPSLSLNGQYSFQSQADDFQFNGYNWPKSFFVGIQLTVPIFSGFLNDIKVKQSQLELEQILIRRTMLERQAGVEISNERLSIEEALQKMQLQLQIKTARRQALDFIRSRWQKGVAKYSEVADAELLIIQADNEYTQGLFDYLTAVSSYYKSTGYTF
jgi:hydrophobe/amphiphile efflux-1 (HAE1) family protein